MPRPCHRVHPDPVPDACRLCRLYAEDARYRAKWDDPAHRPAPAAARPPCRHLGAPTGAAAPCRACGGFRAAAPVLACAVHGVCTTLRPAKGFACCVSCPNREDG